LQLVEVPAGTLWGVQVTNESDGGSTVTVAVWGAAVALVLAETVTVVGSATGAVSTAKPPSAAPGST
jgi:hypothetical protein